MILIEDKVVIDNYFTTNLSSNNIINIIMHVACLFNRYLRKRTKKLIWRHHFSSVDSLNKTCYCLVCVCIQSFLKDMIHYIIKYSVPPIVIAEVPLIQFFRPFPIHRSITGVRSSLWDYIFSWKLAPYHQWK